ncbi:MAG: nucleotidyltransferase family protein [Rhodospirillales bacterium]
MADPVHTELTIAPVRSGRTIKQAMVLCAGLGERMRPITETMPKPMIPVGGTPLIDRILDGLAHAGIERAVVNTFYMADMLEAHLSAREKPAIVISRENERLETGGGVLNALDHFGDEPFFVVNGDALWLDGPIPTLDRLEATWDESMMDSLLLLHSTVAAYGYDGRGDFVVAPDGLLARRPEGEVSPYVFTGTQVVHPRLFGHDVRAGALGNVFSFNALFDRALEQDRLYGMIHDGEWFHIGTPDALAEVEAFMNEPFPGAEYRSS